MHRAAQARAQVGMPIPEGRSEAAVGGIEPGRAGSSSPCGIKVWGRNAGPEVVGAEGDVDLGANLRRKNPVEELTAEPPRVSASGGSSFSFQDAGPRRARQST